MLAKRIIPCLDIKDSQVVKGVQFENVTVIGDIFSLIELYNKQGADEIVIYDIAASARGSSVTKQIISQISDLSKVPIAVAGGINSVEIAQQLFASGADKISINTPALVNPQLISDLVNTFGSQSIVIGIDSRYIPELDDYFVYQFSGDDKLRSNKGIRTLDWVEQVQKLGCGEIVLNMINADGTKQGYDIKQLQLVKSISKVPVIASGGAGKPEHFLQAFQETDVDGCLAASIFHRQEYTITDIKKYLAAHQLPIRI